MKKHFFVLPFFTFLAAALFTSCSSSSGDGWNQGDAENRQDYGGGGSGWEQGDFGGREGYGFGGDGWS